MLSSKFISHLKLSAFTGSTERIYPYDRNAEFAHFLLAKALECQPSEALVNASSNFFSEESNEQIKKAKEDEEMEVEPFENKEVKNNNAKEIFIEEKSNIDEDVEEVKTDNQRQSDIASVPLKKEEEEIFGLNLANKLVLPKQKISENEEKKNNFINVEKVLARLNEQFTTKIISTTIPPTLVSFSNTKITTTTTQTTTKQNKQNNNTLRKNGLFQRGRNNDFVSDF